MEIIEKVAYLKGLMEGLGIDESTNEGKVLGKMAEVLGDIAQAVSDIETGVSMISQQMELIDEDLSDLEDDFYDDEDGCDCGCEDEDDDLFEGELYEVTCPSCGDTICVDEDMLDEGEVACPGCGEALEFDLSGELDGSDRGEEE